MGTPKIALPSLRALLNDSRFEVVGVITQPDRPAGRRMQLQPTPVRQSATEYNLQAGQPLPILTPEKVNTAELRDTVAGWRPDVAVVIAFGQILGPKLLALFPRGAVNLHASLLPRWRGAAPIQRALMAGDRWTGLSLQLVVRELDAGPLLGERRFDITDNDDAVSVLDKMAHLGPELLATELPRYLDGELSPVPQDESQVTWAPKIEKSEGHLSPARWSEGAEAVVWRSRGLAAGPGVWTLRSGGRLKLGGLRAIRREHRGQPGEVIGLEDEVVVIASRPGEAVEIRWLQPESRPRLTVREFQSGHSIRLGERWE
jgi:methionyl-tRNA formyltransferase